MLVDSDVKIENEPFGISTWFACQRSGVGLEPRAFVVGPVQASGRQEEGVMRDFPPMSDRTESVERVPRRLRGFLDGEQVFDSTMSVYVWDSPKYPAYYVPLSDLDARLLVDDDHPRKLRRGPTRTFSLRVGDVVRPGSVIVYGEDADSGRRWSGAGGVGCARRLVRGGRAGFRPPAQSVHQSRRAALQPKPSGSSSPGSCWPSRPRP